MEPADARTETKAVFIYSGRNEFQVFIMLLAILTSILLFTDRTPDAENVGIPFWVQAAWALGLTGSAALNLFASFFPWRDNKNGIILEVVSCIGLIITPLFYTLSLLGFLENPSVTRFLAMDLLAIIAAIRAYRLFGYIRQINRLRSIENEIHEVTEQYKRENE